MVSSRKRTLQIDILMDPSGAQRGASQIQSVSGRLSGHISQIGAVTRAAIGVVAAGALSRFGQDMAQQGARIEGIGRRVDTVFGKNATQVRAWAQQNRAAFGMSTSGVLDLAGAFGDLLVPMGFTRDQAAELTTRMLGGANALSEWTGGTKSAAEAGDIMIRAMLGEREGLKSLGIQLDQAAVDALITQRGQQDLTGAARDQAEAVATLDLIWQKSADALLAYQDGGNEALRSQRELVSETAELRDALAVELMPVFNNVVDVALSAAEGVKVVVEWFRNLPGPAKMAALGIGGISGALYALHAHPVLAGVALLGGALAAIGAQARESRQRIDQMKRALEELGEVSVPTLKDMIPPATLDILNRTGITLNDLAAALEDDAAMANLVTTAAQALNTSTSEGYWQYFWLLRALADLNRAYDEAAEELRIQEEAERRAVAQEQAHETMARKLAGATQTLEGNFRTSTGTAAEWTTVLEKARQRVIDLAKAQLEAASPALQVIRARQAHAEAEQRLADLQSQRGQNVAEIREAELNVIETEGRLQAAQGLLTTQLGESTSAFRQLAEDAGFYGDELERIVGLLWDYDKAPKPGPSPYLQEGPL